MKNTFYAIKIKDKELWLSGYYYRSTDVTIMSPARFAQDVPFLFYSKEAAEEALNNKWDYKWPEFQLEVVPVALLLAKEVAELEVDKMLKS